VQGSWWQYEGVGRGLGQYCRDRERCMAQVEGACVRDWKSHRGHVAYRVVGPEKYGQERVVGPWGRGMLVIGECSMAVRDMLEIERWR